MRSADQRAATSSFGTRLLAVLGRHRVSVLVFNDLRQHAIDLVLKSDLELLLHGHVKVVLLAEGLGQRISSVTFVNDDLFNAVLADVNFDVELGVALIDLLVHVVELLVDQVLAVRGALVQHLSSHVRVRRLELVERFIINGRKIVRVHIQGSFKRLHLRIESEARVSTLELVGRSAPRALERHNRYLARLFTIEEFSVCLLLLVGAHLRRARVVILDLARVFAQTLDALRSREAAAARHQLLEFFLLTRLLSSLNMTVDSVDLIVLEQGVTSLVLARQHVRLGEVRVEAALVGIPLILVVLHRFVLLVDCAARLKIQVNVRVTCGRSARFLEEASLVSLGMMRQLFAFFFGDIIAHFLEALVFLLVARRVEQHGDDVDLVAHVVHLALPIDDGGRRLGHFGHVRRLRTANLGVDCLIFLLM